jgi:hypothetical protein
MQETFHIGDHVKFIDDEEFSFEIIATTATPHVTIDKAIISVPAGSEYVLRMLNQKKSFEPYRYTIGRHITKV